MAILCEKGGFPLFLRGEFDPFLFTESKKQNHHCNGIVKMVVLIPNMPSNPFTVKAPFLGLISEIIIINQGSSEVVNQGRYRWNWGGCCWINKMEVTPFLKNLVNGIIKPLGGRQLWTYI